MLSVRAAWSIQPDDSPIIRSPLKFDLITERDRTKTAATATANMRKSNGNVVDPPTRW